MRYLYVLIFVAFLFASSSAQVDTLGVVWMGSIQVPSAIRELYIEDLDGDSIKEIIIAASSNVHIYNGITYQEIWTSPEIVGPRDLKFADLNNDGLLDLAVRQGYLYPCIYLLDPHNSYTIWTSPIVDDSLKCYAVGDRNGDDWVDVAVVRKEPFTRYNVENNMDTVWVYIYDGPTYDSVSSIILTLPNYELFDGLTTTVNKQIPNNAEICLLGDSLNATPMVLLFNEIEFGQYGPYPSIMIYYGEVHVFDGQDLTVEYIYEAGMYLSGNIFTLQNDNTYKYYSESIGISDLSSDLTIYEIALSNDTAAYYDVLFYDTNSGPPYPPITFLSLRWLLHGEMNQNNNNREVALAYYIPWPERSRVCLYTELSGDLLWSLTSYQSLTNDGFVLSYPSIFNERKIAFKFGTPNSKYNLLDGRSGEIDGLINLISEIMRIDDADNDLDDEIYVKISNNVISINSLELLTDVYEYTPEIVNIELSNYPNPFNSSTTIEYGLPEVGQVRIDIYDLLGRKVETLVDEEMQAGRHQVVWDAAGRPSGIYFYRIKVGDFVDTKRMVYLK